MAQWLRILLPMQETRVQSLVQEDPTGRRATKPVRCNYWACPLESASHNYWSLRATTTEACEPQLLKPARLEPVLHNKRSHCNEKPAHCNKDPTHQNINKLINWINLLKKKVRCKLTIQWSNCTPTYLSTINVNICLFKDFKWMFIAV